jgi:glutamyl-Q tRNA(Asp) synthetase
MIVSRFAPSPTGRLHLGHAFSAVRAHDLARAAGGAFLLRIEDIDGTRSREEYVAGIEEDLRWLGLAWDGPVLRQSERMPVYAEALDRLKAMGLIYPCFCTRAEIAASASAPHGPEGPVYPGTCRGLSQTERAARMGEPHCWRLDMAGAVEAAKAMEMATAPAPSPLAGEGWGEGFGRLGDQLEAARHPTLSQPSPVKGEGFFAWHDASLGWVQPDPLAAGDVVLARKETPTSYHLAVTVDDAAQGVTDVVRGVDLFEATRVHRLLQALLGLPTPRYHHHPLLIGPDGKRLAKRNGAKPLAELRAEGADPARLLAALRQGQVPIGAAAGEA